MTSSRSWSNCRILNDKFSLRCSRTTNSYSYNGDAVNSINHFLRTKKRWKNIVQNFSTFKMRMIPKHFRFKYFFLFSILNGQTNSIHCFFSKNFFFKLTSTLNRIKFCYYDINNSVSLGSNNPFLPFTISVYVSFKG